MRIRRDDNVKILSGKDRGKQGKVTRVFPGAERLIVEGVNVRKKRVRPRRQGAKGQVVEFAHPIHASNVLVVCGECKSPTRIGIRRDGAQKSRVCRKCHSAL